MTTTTGERTLLQRAFFFLFRNSVVSYLCFEEKHFDIQVDANNMKKKRKEADREEQKYRNEKREKKKEISLNINLRRKPM